MNDENQTNGASGGTVTPEEALENLKQRATQLGISFKGNIGADTLAQKIKDHLAAEEEEEKPLSRTEEMAKIRREARAEAMKLVRVRITCMNPSKKDMHGEIFTVANRFIGNVTKFVPYNVENDEGYHVPNVLLKALKARKFLQITTKQSRKNSAQINVSTKFVPEFAIEILPQLTEEELKELAAAQAAKGGIS